MRSLLLIRKSCLFESNLAVNLKLNYRIESGLLKLNQRVKNDFFEILGSASLKESVKYRLSDFFASFGLFKLVFIKVIWLLFLNSFQVNDVILP